MKTYFQSRYTKDQDAYGLGDGDKVASNDCPKETQIAAPITVIHVPERFIQTNVPQASNVLELVVKESKTEIVWGCYGPCESGPKP